MTDLVLMPAEGDPLARPDNHAASDQGLPLTCGTRRGPRSATRCELPPDHMVGRLPGEPVREVNHLGRSRTGRWYSWPPEVKP